MAIKKRTPQQATVTGTTESAELDQRAEAFGHGAYSPVATPPAAELNPRASVGPQGILFRYNDYQKALLKDSA